MSKSADAFRTIGEVAGELDIPKHVLRFWEGRFPQIRPMKRGGGRRYYRPEDMELLRGIRALLHAEGYTIRGVQKILREHGVDQVKAAARRVATATSRATEAAGRKRGRKPVANAAPAVPAPEPAPAAAPTAATGESLPATPASLTSKAQVLTAIRELKIARAILLGQPLNQPSAVPDAKKVRAGRP